MQNNEHDISAIEYPKFILNLRYVNSTLHRAWVGTLFSGSIYKFCLVYDRFIDERVVISKYNEIYCGRLDYNTLSMDDIYHCKTSEEAISKLEDIINLG